MQIYFTKYRNFFYICAMNANIGALYAVILDNRVVVTETNLTAFAKKFHEVEPKGFKYVTLFGKFKASKEFTQTIGGKTYYFQQLHP